MPIFIATGFKGPGQKAEPVSLHVGTDKQEALNIAAEAVRAGREGITAAEVFTCHRGTGKRFDPARIDTGGVEAEREANLERAAAEYERVKAEKAKADAEAKAKADAEANKGSGTTTDGVGEGTADDAGRKPGATGAGPGTPKAK